MNYKITGETMTNGNDLIEYEEENREELELEFLRLNRDDYDEFVLSEFESR